MRQLLQNPLAWIALTIGLAGGWMLLECAHPIVFQRVTDAEFDARIQKAMQETRQAAIEGERALREEAGQREAAKIN